MPRLRDTTPEAEQILASIYRTMPPLRKWRLLAEEMRCVRLLHDAGFRHHQPEATPEQIQQAWVLKILGPGPWQATRDSILMEQPIESLEVVREVIAVLERLEIDYVLGGSFASSFHGAARLTRDADLAVEPFPGKEHELVKSFGPEYYLSLEAIRQALRDHSCFNIIHTMIGFKVDIFVSKDRAFERSMMRRRVAVPFPDVPEHPIQLTSAEDIILLKLEWYRLGNEVSDNQWSDILNVLRVQAGHLDEAYLDHWAAELGVSDLLARALEEART